MDSVEVQESCRGAANFPLQVQKPVLENWGFEGNDQGDFFASVHEHPAVPVQRHNANSVL